METNGKVIIGVATLDSRRKFFVEKVLPNLLEMADRVYVYENRPDGRGGLFLKWKDQNGNVRESFCTDPWGLGDAGKFLGIEMLKQQEFKEDFYYLSCDDDLIYPLDYAKRMIEWVDFFGKKAVVSLHGSTFREMPIESYYKQKLTIPCRGNFPTAQRVLFLGSGAACFHSSTLDINVKEQFPVKNMADIWFGKVLLEQGVPGIILPHSKDYLIYDEGLDIKETIWGQEHQKDFLQTAVVNQLSLNPGLQLHPVDWPDAKVPQGLGVQLEADPQQGPDQQELFETQAQRSEESDTSEGASETTP